MMKISITMSQSEHGLVWPIPENLSKYKPNDANNNTNQGEISIPELQDPRILSFYAVVIISVIFFKTKECPGFSVHG